MKPEKPNFFQQTPVSSKPPVVPHGTDLNSIAREAEASKAKIDAENKKNMDAFMAREREILANIYRAEMADEAKKAEAAKTAEANRLWHERNAKERADKENRKRVAEQTAVKTRIAKFISDCAIVANDLQIVEDKNCVQVKLLREAVSAMLKSFPESE